MKRKGLTASICPTIMTIQGGNIMKRTHLLAVPTATVPVHAKNPISPERQPERPRTIADPVDRRPAGENLMTTVRRVAMLCLTTLTAIAASGCGAYPRGFHYYACSFTRDSLAVLVRPELGCWSYHLVGDSTWSFASSLSSTHKIIAYGAREYVPASPDSVAAYKGRELACSVIVEDWAGKRRWRLPEFDAASLALSPDAKRVAFLGWEHKNGVPRMGPEHGGLYVWDYEKGTVTRIAGNESLFGVRAMGPSPSWLSNTQVVATLNGNRICSIEVTGTQQPAQQATGRYPVVSPDGRYMAYLADQKYVVRDFRSGNETVLTVLPDSVRSTEAAVWTPDSRYVGYVKYKSGLDKQWFIRRIDDGKTFLIAGFYGEWAYSRHFRFIDEDFVQHAKARSSRKWVFNAEPRR